MTVAICLKCGAFKHGAWTPCLKCGYQPDDDESYTKHLLVTDHYLSQDELKAASEQIKSGGKIDFPDDVLQKSWVTKEMVEANSAVLGRGCGIIYAGLWLLAAILACIAVYMFMHRSH